MTDKNRSKGILKIAAAFFAGFILPRIIYYVFGRQLNALIPDTFILTVALQIFESVLTVGLIFLLGKKDTLKIRKGGLKEGILSCSFLIVIQIVLLLSKISEITAAGNVSASRVILALIYCVLIGITEEGLFRGLITDISLDITGIDTHKKAAIGIVIPSLLFGALHLTNALSPDISLATAAVQALSAACAGAFLAVAFFRGGRSIWPGVIIHAIVDFAGFVSGGMLQGASDTEAIGNLSVGGLIMIPLYLVIVYIIFRKEKYEQAVSLICG